MQVYDIEDLEAALRGYKPRGMLVTRYDEPARYKIESTLDEVNCSALECMWRTAYRVNRLVPDDEDLVVRCRYDLFFFDGADELIERGLALQSDQILIPEGGDYRGGVFDMFAIGSKRVMDYYHDLYRLIPQYSSEGKSIHSESLFGAQNKDGGVL